MTAWLLSLSPQSQLERSTGSRLTVLVKPGDSVSRRSLYTAGSGGIAGRAWDSTRQPVPASQLVPLKQQQPGAAGSIAQPPGVASGQHSSSSSGGSGPGPGGAAAAADSIPEPADFNWKSYLLRYPDLRSGNIRTKQAAAWHYTQKGHKEHRSFAKIPILLRYTACQGLFNQMYAHLNALVLADYLGADVMLPPSVYRESFSKYFSMDLKKNEVKWTPADTGALLDVDAIQAHYAQKGIKVLRTAPYESFPDCMHPQDAFPRYNMPDVHKDQIVRLGDTYLQSMHIWYIWDRAAEKILAKHKQLVAAGHPPNTTVVLDLPCPFLSIMTLTCMEAAQEAATALKFNRTIVQMARTIINGMRGAGIARYNGAHLRLEKDAVDWARILGGFKKYLAEYARSFAAAGFNKRKDLYIASGLLSYNASQEMKDMLTFLEPHSRSVQYKEMYLPAGMLNSLNPEQEALVDFLVLANSDNFVGLGSSTFSVYLREYRVLLGHARLADVFVDTSRIGTDALFERCTHFAPLDTTAVGSWHKPTL
uniref:O-fucosyltransferase family protein n=1 Tax=Tetradesmus obliquus TaxID=3088 RepID=A0A383W2H7_TETOB|eukprot:jgi/Sobl393_1/3005/SZX71847.1